MLLPVRMVEKPWGRDVLPPPFAAPEAKRIGEIWFEPPAQFDALLGMYLFTSEKLSVQVHPGGALSKEECWLVIAAEPEAALGSGVREPTGSEAMRDAALDGSIEHLLDWRHVRPGDFFYIPPGTVHAIGAGVSLIEVQQNRDITYRLYDYGRPRELHLDDGIAVATGAPHDPALRRHLPSDGSLTLAEGPPFRLDRVEGAVPDEVARRYGGSLFAVPLAGTVKVAGETVAPGQCALARTIADVAIADDASCLLAQPCGAGE